MHHYGFFGRLAYKASYGVSYGVVYPVTMVARMIPKENAMVYGLSDGASAARDEAKIAGKQVNAEIGHHEGSMAHQPA